jgi:hypothetical protein
LRPCRRLAPSASIIELLALPGAEDVALDAPRLDDLARPPDLA